ncbi:MAG: class I SAM-dependent methyltransferase [Patescibacteria group bacterium]|jgi:ubiquinone/menaquinone biosynthesis C-methylase UbiE|nr:class I SAM-dependent methyltransferase [Patescibacteria group bacterium]
MKSETASKIIKQTTNDYDQIAVDFNQTRQYLWPGMDKFKQEVHNGDKILDLGCGNGKLRLLFKDLAVEYIGVDNSQQQLEFAKCRDDFKIVNQEFIKAEVFELPFASDSFNEIFCLAVLHHIPGRKRREQTLKEIKRVLKPGGKLIMTNWNRWQKQYLHYIIKHGWEKIFKGSELDFKDIYLPWMDGTVKRYYHAFTLAELRKLVIESGLKLEHNKLWFWSGQEAKSWQYLKAANIVTMAKKC